LRRDPKLEQIKYICFVGACKDGTNTEDVRGFVKANVIKLYMNKVRNYKIYDYVELPDESGTVSWLVVQKSYLGAALVHATGTVDFIKMVEMFAESRKMEFGASGLKANGVKLVTPTEEDLFLLLGSRYISPSERATVRFIDPLDRTTTA
jgi:DNA polymerase/3'-5' exonuclease PolX